MVLCRDITCDKCSLHKTSRHRCIPTTYLGGDGDMAVLWVGEHPGVEEVQAQQSFVGPSGQRLRHVYTRWVDAKTQGGPWGLEHFGTNAARCKPPQGGHPTQGNLKACRDYLFKDIETLRDSYVELVVVACGGPASWAISGRTLGASLRHQGELHPTLGVRVFYTHNPAMLLPGRNPSAIRSVEDHLSLIASWIRDGKMPIALEVPTNWKPLQKLPREAGQKDCVVAVDLETYGSVEGLPVQTVFHPAKAVYVDKCPRESLVVCASASWWEGGVVKSAAWSFPSELAAFEDFMEDAVYRGFDILGQNLCFDLMFMRAYSPRLHKLLTRRSFTKHKVRLRELGVANFLENDTREEKTLKALAPLLGIASYAEGHDLKDGWRYSSADDPELLQYCVLDTVATLGCWDELARRIQQRWPHSEKLGSGCLSWFNDLLWSVLGMDEAGIHFDRVRLEALREKTRRRYRRMAQYAWWRWLTPIKGEGSARFGREVMDEALVKADLVNDRRVERTPPPHRIVSVNEANTHLVLGYLNPQDPLAMRLRYLEAFKKTKKILTSYLEPLLSDPKGGLTGNHAFPSWFVTPAYEHDDSARRGGTQQGRLTCKGPAKQTFPPVIYNLECSRWEGGLLLKPDLSQIELRVMALLSNDPVMMQEYIDDVDLHTSMGSLILHELWGIMTERGLRHYQGVDRDWLERTLNGPLCKEIPGFGKWRQMGKTVNFAIGFKATPPTLQASIRRDMRVELDRPFCARLVSTTYEKYKRLAQYQDELVAAAKQNGCTVLPITGESRSFLGGSFAIDETYISTICNHPIQTIASRILQSAQNETHREIEERRLHSLIVDNVYDAFTVDVYPGEKEQVAAIAHRNLLDPPYYQALCKRLGRRVPLAYETKEVV